MNMLSHRRSPALGEETDQKMWVTRDYFWAVGAGLIANTVPNWRSFQAGFADRAAVAPARPKMEAR